MTLYIIYILYYIDNFYIVSILYGIFKYAYMILSSILNDNLCRKAVMS